MFFAPPPPSLPLPIPPISCVSANFSAQASVGDMDTLLFNGFSTASPDRMTTKGVALAYDFKGGPSLL